MKLYDENLWSKANQKNKDILEDYKLELESQGKAEKTIQQYMFDLRGFVCWVTKERDNQDILDLKRRDFRRFFLDMQKSGCSAARVNRFESSVRNCLNYCVLDDDEYSKYEINPLALMKGLSKKPVKKIDFLTDKEINILLDYFMRKNDYQKALWVELSYSTCARRNEILQIKKDAFLNNDATTNVVIGKRGKSFKLIISKRARIIASIYLKNRGNDDCDSLWVKNSNKQVVPLKYSAFYDWAQKCCKVLNDLEGTDYKFGPHEFRHAGAECYTNGTHHELQGLGVDKLDIGTLKVLLHHSDISTSESYLKNHDLDKLENAFGIKM